MARCRYAFVSVTMVAGEENFSFYYLIGPNSLNNAANFQYKSKYGKENTDTRIENIDFVNQILNNL